MKRMLAAAVPAVAIALLGGASGGAAVEPKPCTTPVGGAFSTATIGRAQAVGTRARRSVVYIEVEARADGSGGAEFGSGTGFAVSGDLVLTNQHVIAGARRITVWTLDGRRFRGRVVVADGDVDVALVRLPRAARLPPLRLTTARGVTRRQPLVAVGHPGGAGHWLVTLGRLVKQDRSDGYRDIVTTIPGLEGSSGSPVLDLDGNVVGFVYAGEDPGEGGRPKPSSARVRTELIPRSLEIAVSADDALAAVGAYIPR